MRAWKKIDGLDFKLYGLSHMRPLAKDEIAMSVRKRGYSPKTLTERADVLRQMGFYARILEMPLNRSSGQRTWGLYIRPKNTNSFENRTNSIRWDAEKGEPLELPTPYEWEPENISKNKRRAGQLKNWRKMREKGFRQMQKKFTRHADSPMARMSGEKNEDLLQNIDDYLSARGQHLVPNRIPDHQGKPMNNPNRFANLASWDLISDRNRIGENNYFPDLDDLETVGLESEDKDVRDAVLTWRSQFPIQPDKFPFIDAMQGVKVYDRKKRR